MKPSYFFRVQQYRAKARSQAFIEFAVILPVFLTLVCGLLDYGYMVGNSLELAVAAREGANSGARQFNDQMIKGLSAAVNVAKPRLLINSYKGGGVLTRVVYHDDLSTTKFYLVDTNNPTNSCASTGSIYGGNDSLKNRSHLLDASNGTNNLWLAPTRVLPCLPTVLNPDSQVLTVMEVFYTNSFVTPIGSLIGLVTPPVLYDVAYY